MKTNDIFISYSTKNTEIAQKIKMLFQSHGITCWMAPESIPAGSNYTKEIPTGIIYSKLAVVVLSAAAINSVWVNQEITYLLETNHTIIPFIVEELNDNTLQEPFSKLLCEHDNICQLKQDDAYSKLLAIAQHQLGKVTSFTIPNSADDYLQMGLLNIGEEGGLIIDRGHAEEFLTKAASLGNSEAMRLLAILIQDERTSEEAEIWWEKAAQNGDVHAQIHETKRYMRYNDYDAAFNMIMNAVNEKVPEALYLYAELLLNKIQPNDNSSYAHELLEESLQLGYYHSACLLGDLYKEGNGVAKNPQKAFEYYKYAAESDENEEEAALKLADCYFEGFGTEKKIELAFELYRDFCFYSSQYIKKYADCFYYGYGTRKNKKKAAEMYSMINLETEFEENELPQQVKEEIHEKLLELGDAHTESLTAWNLYHRGEFHKAYKLFKKASIKENQKATLGLAICYFNGQGVKYNGEEAFLHFVKAYSSGCKDAAIYLAKCYEKGIGTFKNIEKAKLFYDIAKQDENKQSLTNKIFENGIF